METNAAHIETVLLVEGDSEDMDSIRRCIAELGFRVTEASSLRGAISAIRKNRPALVLSELVLSDGSGFNLCRVLRENPTSSTIPIVLISHWSTEGDRILAFLCGADDFVAKPFYVRELSARIRAVIRRSQVPAPDETSESVALEPPFEVQPEVHSVRIGDRSVILTPRELAILIALIGRGGRVISRRELLEEVWQSDNLPQARNIDVHIKSLRRKLALCPDPIETVRGVGYRLSRSPIVR